MTIAAQAGAGIAAASATLCDAEATIGCLPTRPGTVEAVTDATVPAVPPRRTGLAGLGIAFAGELADLTSGSGSGFDPTAEDKSARHMGFASFDNRHGDIECESSPGA
jgi:hypothetical protein